MAQIFAEGISQVGGREAVAECVVEIFNSESFISSSEDAVNVCECS